MSPLFREVRENCRNPMLTCHLCRHPFEDGESVALACFSKGGNKTLCDACADNVLSCKIQ